MYWHCYQGQSSVKNNSLTNSVVIYQCKLTNQRKSYDLEGNIFVWLFMVIYFRYKQNIESAKLMIFKLTFCFICSLLEQSWALWHFSGNFTPEGDLE